MIDVRFSVEPAIAYLPGAFLHHLTQKQHRAQIILTFVADDQKIIRLAFPDILDDMIHLNNHEIGEYESNNLNRMHEWSVKRFTNMMLFSLTSLAGRERCSRNGMIAWFLQCLPPF
jgi:hypothetical protein